LSDSHITDDAFINSIIGEGTRFKGEFDLNGLLRIDGDFTGVIRTKGKVLIGKNGRAECTLHAGTVVVGGVIRGEIYSTEKVVILSTGLVLGAITTPRLIIEEGVVFNGSCKVTSPQPAETAKGSPGNGQRPGAAGAPVPPRENNAAKAPPTMAAPGPRR
jgi:cytoskeletal protein CcmA (bactofilin family)